MAAKKKKKRKKRKIKETQSNPRSLGHMSGALPMSHSVHGTHVVEKTYTYAFSSQRHTIRFDKSAESFGQTRAQKGYPVLSRYKSAWRIIFQPILHIEVIWISSDILLKSRKIWSPFGPMNSWSCLLKIFELELAGVWLKNAYRTAVLHSLDPMKLLLLN